MATRDRPKERSETKINSFIRKDLLKLYDNVIIDYKAKKQPEDLTQIKEINQLLEYCSDGYPFEATSFSSHLLLNLCDLRIIPNEYLLRKLLTISATNKNLSCAVSTIFELLIMDIKKQVEASGQYTNPYNLRSPQHPLITVFQQRPDSSCVIFNKIQNHFLKEDRNSRTVDHILDALRPFLGYVILDPNCSSKSWEFLSLYSMLTQLIKRMHEYGRQDISIDIANFLLQMVSCRKTTDLLIYDTINSTEVLALCLLDLPSEAEFESIIIAVGYLVMSQCHKLLQMNLDISVHFNLMQMIFIQYPKGFMTVEFVYLLALLVYRSPSLYKECILELAMHVLPCFTTYCRSISQLIVLKAFVLPLIIILTNDIGLEEEKNQQKLAVNILTNIGSRLDACMGSTESEENDIAVSFQTPMEVTLAKHHSALIREINSSPSSAKAFLKSLKETKTRNDSILLVFSSLLVNPVDSSLLNESLLVLSELCKHDASLAVGFLPLLLHASNNSRNPKIKFQILESLPSLAVNKQMLSPVLKAVEILGTCAGLLPFSIRVMTELWKIQPRIFQYLFKLLSKSVKASEVSADVWEEMMVAKAASIYEICKLRPVQHGPDVIGLLAAIFDNFEQGNLGTCADVAETVVYLGLEALKCLCDAEVSDFQTAWAVVSSKLLPCPSDLILKGIISLLSITPKVLGDSTIDLNLRKFACDFIWQNVGHKNPNVSSAASARLINFTTEEFMVERLQEKARLYAIDLYSRKHNMKKRDENDDYDPTQELISGPIYAYLLQNVQCESAIGFSLLLSHVLKQEVQALPRNISTANAAKRQGATFDRFIDSIPGFLTSCYEKSSSPVLIPGIAAGILSCYNGTVHVGQREKAGKRHFIQDAKDSRQMLDTLLSEISVEHTDWRQSITAQTSWSRFMGRVLDATIEGRKADLTLLFDQGQFPSQEEFKDELSDALYWARDQLTTQLMKASKGDPRMQGNSIFGLAGLAVIISSENEPLVEKQLSMRYCSNKDWLVKVADTVMVVLDGNFKPKGRPMQWCQQYSSHKSTASSLLSRACAAVVLSEIAATLISVDFERIQQMFQLLIFRLPGQEKAGTSSVIQFNAAFGLGMLITRLQQERFSDVIGNEGNVLTANAFHVLETTLYNEDLQNREGAIFGHGLALGALFTDATKDSRNRALLAYEKLINKVRSLEFPKTERHIEESYFFALGVSTIGGFKSGAINTDDVLKSIDMVQEMCRSHPKSCTLQAIYGILLHGLLSCGLSQVKDAINENVDSWLKTAVDVNIETGERIAAVHGVLTAFGALSFLFQFENLDVFDANLKSKLAVVIRKLQQVLETNTDAELCLYVCKFLGFLHMIHHGGASTQTVSPSNYNYLADSSILRSSFNCLLEAGKSGPNGRFSPPAVNAILLSYISVAENVKLPPVNWPQVLNSLMKTGFGTETRRLCLKFAVGIAHFCSTLPIWLLSWMNPPVFLTLEVSCKREITDKIDSIVNIIPLNKLKIVIEDMMIKTYQNEVSFSFFTQDASLEEKLLVLGSLKTLASMASPVQSSLACVQRALIKVCQDETMIQSKDILKGVANVLFCLPKELRDNVMETLQTTDCIVCVESAMVSFFQMSLKSMDMSIKIFSADPASLSSRSLAYLKYALQRHFLNSSSAKMHSEEVFWFLEQMRKIKSFAVHKMTDKIKCWLEVLSSTTNTWSSSGLYVALIDEDFHELFTQACTDLFGVQLNNLLLLPNWQHLNSQVLNWLIELAEIYKQDLNEVDGSMDLLKGSILHISQSEMQKISQEAWSRSIEIILS